MKSICVYCGANPGASPEFATLAQVTGTLIASQGMTLVYGGGAVGLMGIVARAALAAGGEVIGVIPQALMDLEVSQPNLTRLHVVPDMHTRKAKMAALADGFMVLPGGFGTLDELFEIITWGQLGFHRKPIGLIDHAAFYAPLLTMIEHLAEQGFVRPQHRELFVTGVAPEDTLTAMRAWTPIEAKKWLPTTLDALAKA